MRVIIHILIFGIELHCFSQSYSIEQYSTIDGLMTNDVVGVFQDEFGIIWAANGQGFTKFFGDHSESLKSNFFVFEYGPLRELCLSHDEYSFTGARLVDNKIYRDESHAETAFLVAGSDTAKWGGFSKVLDQSGYLWTNRETADGAFDVICSRGTDTINVSSILNKFNLVASNVTYHLSSNSNLDYDLLPFVPSTFIVDNLGNLWIRLLDGKLALAELITNKPFILDPGLSNIAAMNRYENLYWFTVYPSDTINYGVFSYDGKQLKKYPANGEAQILISPNGEIWLLDDLGVSKLINDKFQIILTIPGILQAKNNSYGELVMRHKTSSGTYAVSFLNPNGLTTIYESTNFLYPFVIDFENNIWIPSAGNGLIKCTRQNYSYVDQSAFRTNLYTQGDTRYLFNFNPDTRVYTKGYNAFLIERNDSLIEIQTETEKKRPVYYKSGQSLYYTDYTKTGLSDSLTFKICRLRADGKVTHPYEKWTKKFDPIAVDSDVILRFYGDTAFLAIKNYWYLFDESAFKKLEFDTSLYSSYMFGSSDIPFMIPIALKRKVDNNESNTTDLKILNYKTGVLEDFKFENDTINFYGYPALYELRNDKKLLLKLKNHVCIIEENSVSYLPSPVSKITGKPIDLNSGIKINNAIYFRTIEDGLVRFDFEQLSFIQFTMGDGLETNQIYSVFTDPDTNYLWMASPYSLQRINIKQAELHRKLNWETWTQSEIFRTGFRHEFKNDSIMFLFSDNGYMILNIKNMYHETKPLVHFTKVELSNKTTNWGRFSCEIDTTFGRQIPDKIELDYFENNIEFYFQGVSHVSKLTYNYQLEGYESGFHQTSSKSVRYTNLDPGNYKFKLQVLDDYDSHSETISISFSIKKPYWETVWFYILIITFSISSVLIYFRWRTSKLRARQIQLERDIEKATAEIVQQKNEVEHQKEQIEEAHKEITDSINYAERIQRSLMASKKMLDENLKDYFVYFNPKEKVSGDFYWTSILYDQRFCIVAADSTGHGVPGAIMSMLNISSLEKAVTEKISTSDALLNFTRSKIIQTLANDGSAECGKEGMDAVLLIFNKEKSELEFSMANNPVWIIRNGELIEFKPDKMPVGKHDKQAQPFTRNSEELQLGDLIYIFTDGFADQFGGEKGKKFKYSSLKELFLSVADKPMDEQKLILSKTFDNWRGNLEQVDDVCVIGIRV